MPLQSLDIKARSATTTQPPTAREPMHVAKLIDISMQRKWVFPRCAIST